MKQRIEFLDGHRGLAILMVIFFHAYARWPELVPYGNSYKFPFEYGPLGVQLFFLISGFVILLTLEKCHSYGDFIFRRWIRLFPAMLFCSVAIFLSAPFFIERPAGSPALIGLLPGLLFVEPAWIEYALGQPVNPLEGAFWSLYVEFKFYIVAGGIYFIFGRSKLPWTLFLLTTIGYFFQWLGATNTNQTAQDLSSISEALSLRHFGWFAAGASAYLYTQTKNERWFIYACMLSVYCSVFYQLSNIKVTLVALSVSGLFMATLVNQWLKNVFGSKFFQFFGYISYPLYLIHENAMISSVVKLGNTNYNIPQFLYPLVPVIGLILFSYICARYSEPIIRNFLYYSIDGANRILVHLKSIRKN